MQLISIDQNQSSGQVKSSSKRAWKVKFNNGTSCTLIAEFDVEHAEALLIARNQFDKSVTQTCVDNVE